MLNQNKDFDPKKAEQNELDLLLEKGVVFKVPKRSILRHFSKKKERKFLIKQPYAGTLDRLANEFINIQYNLDDIKTQGLQEGKRLAAKHSKTMARVVAIAILNSKWRIKWYLKPLSRYLLWRVNPTMLRELASTITVMCNFEDFIHSIILMSAARTTAPKADMIEKKQAD